MKEVKIKCLFFKKEIRKTKNPTYKKNKVLVSKSLNFVEYEKKFNSTSSLKLKNFFNRNILQIFIKIFLLILHS